VIDPDHFQDGDTPVEIQAKRIALTWDMQTKYAPLIDEVLHRPMSDPTRGPDLNRLIQQQKTEMDERFAQATKKPIIRQIEMSSEGHLRKNRSLSPHTFVFHLGIKPIACSHCGNLFIKSKKHRKYCSQECEERAKRIRYIQKRRQNRMNTNSEKNDE
jgi:hypothetical protein